MGLDMSLYIRKKDYKNKIPMEALKNYGDIEDIDNTEEFIKKVGTIKLAELIMSKMYLLIRNIILIQHGYQF